MTTFLATHLWQSTLFAAAAAALAWLLKTNHARTRHLVWLIASVKFLVPFSALVALGRQMPWFDSGMTAALPPGALALMDAASQPFAVTDAILAATPAAQAFPLDLTTILVAIWAAGTLTLGAIWLTRWRDITRLRRDAVPMTGGREVELLRQVVRTSGLREVPLFASGGSLEPGVVGYVRPVILWPSDISSRMSDAQLSAILLHELSHVARRDNLLALMHMSVQAIFWFHPVVWWIGARLIDERERACDEAVVRHGIDPRQYAESILRTCEYAIESPLACVAGVTGADIKRRVSAIVRNHPSARLGALKLALLTLAGVVVTVGPIAAGMVTGTPEHAPRPEQARADLTFEVASIKLLRPTGGAAAVAVGGGQGNYYRHTGSVRVMIQQAYGTRFFQQIGAPEWIREDNYDITAKIPDGVTRTPENTQVMVRALLAERFNLKAREEVREIPVYALSHARTDRRLGPGLKPAPGDCQEDDAREDCRGRISSRLGMLLGTNVPFARFAPLLEFAVGRPVVDRTGITGQYGWNVNYAPDQAANAGASELPSLFTALQEQLGLKLESTRAPIPVVVIDSIDRPTDD